MEKRKKDWFRVKNYPHIGLPIRYKDKKWVTKYITNPDNISTHAFLPFIHKKVIKRRYRRSIKKDGASTKCRSAKKKERELYYSNHLDSNIYSYYAFILSEKYEQILKKRNIEDVVTAYRRIPVHPNNKHSRNKCNIDFANEVFDFIRKNHEKHLVAISFDIKSFFDNLDHKIIKKSWCSILGVNTLDDAHYNVYKNITKFSYIEEYEIFHEFKNEIIIETKSGKQKRKKIDKIKYLRNQSAIAFCKKNEFKQRIAKKGYIKKNKYIIDSGEIRIRNKGIPQGSPISSILANIYLLDFDTKINNYVKKNNGLYRRYSDDMVVICNADLRESIISLLKSELIKFGLETQESKTQIFHFKRNKDKYSCYFESQNGNLVQNRNFEYLGFQFDGYFALLKSSSLAKFYRKMKRTLNRSTYYAKFTKNGKLKGELFRTRLYKKFSYLGAKRRMKYVKDKTDPSKWIKTYKYDWGNFLTYAYFAARIMDNNKIKHQVKNHWNILNKLIKEKEEYLKEL